MAELPEILKYSSQMDREFRDKKITGLELLQDKCANIPVGEFQRYAVGQVVRSVFNKGKWIVFALDSGYMLLSLGMGADLLLHQAGGDLPEKYHVCLTFEDGRFFTVRFWWFGKFLWADAGKLGEESNTKDIGIHALDEALTFDAFRAMCRGKKTGVKAFLMNQKYVSGIGNMYMHDILFEAGVHPQMKLSDLDEGGLKKLYDSMQGRLRYSLDKGSFAKERDIYGEGGSYDVDDFLVGYREEKPCPKCGAAVETVKAAGSASYLCPKCQHL